MSGINNTATEKRDVYTTVTSQIINAIEQGVGSWRMPWHMDASTAFSPVSVRGLKPYRGMNTVILWSEATRHGYESALWGTFEAWKEYGGHVRKGAKGTMVCFWHFGNEDEDGNKAVFCKPYAVFNYAQTEGVELKNRGKVELKPKWERIQAAEEFFSRTGARITHGGNQAFYSPSEDYVRMPLREQFGKSDGYYSTLGHECGHWTGHASRLSREFGKRFGDNAYAVEELVAELTAAFLMSNLGLSNEPRPDHAQYIASWLRVLKSDRRAIFTAASKAQQAADFLWERTSGSELAEVA